MMSKAPRTEFKSQAMVCDYLRSYLPHIIFISDLSGIWMPPGLAYKIAPLKSSRGIPDLIILEPFIHQDKSYNGLAIEMKAEGKNPFKKNGDLKSDEHLREQYDMLLRLRDKGYYADFCVGHRAAIDLIQEFYQ